MYEFKLNPLSFKEFLKLKGIEVKFEEYLRNNVIELSSE